MIDSEEAARVYLAEIGGAHAVEQLDVLSRKLADENTRQNLVAARSLEHVWQRHFADSAQLLRHVPRETRSWLDLGSGAGFPGLVLALLLPECQVVLVESRRKRIEWLERMAELLALENVRVVGQRLELVEPFEAGAITARAFAPLDKLLTLSADFSAPDTVWVLPKGRSASQELTEALETWTMAFHVEPSLTDPDSAIIVGRGKPKRRGRR